MIILVEGSCGAGKTTLVRRLKRYLNWKVTKYTNHVTAEEAVGVTMKHLFKNFNEPEILDRCHFPSNLIYGKIINGYDHPEPIRNWYLNDVQDRLLELNTFIIYLTADIDTLSSRLDEKGDYVVKPEKLKDLNDAYENWFNNQLQVPAIRIDTTNMEETDLFSLTLQEILQQQGRRGLNESLQYNARISS